MYHQPQDTHQASHPSPHQAQHRDRQLSQTRTLTPPRERTDCDPRAEACRLPTRPETPPAADDRPDLTSLRLLQQHQVRRPDPFRDQQQRDHQRGEC